MRRFTARPQVSPIDEHRRATRSLCRLRRFKIRVILSNWFQLNRLYLCRKLISECRVRLNAAWSYTYCISRNVMFELSFSWMPREDIRLRWNVKCGLCSGKNYVIQMFSLFWHVLRRERHLSPGEMWRLQSTLHRKQLSDAWGVYLLRRDFLC